MRAFKAILGIFSLLIFHLSSFAGEHKLTVKSVMLKQYTSILNKAYVSAIKDYQKNINNPKRLIAKLPKEERAYLTKVMKAYKIKKLPKIKPYKGGHILEVEGNTVAFDPTFLLTHKINFNGKRFRFDKDESMEENSRRLQKFMGAKKTTSIMNLFIDEANAAGFFLLAGLVVGTVALGAIIYKKVKDNFLDNSGEMKEFREQVKEKKNKCETDLDNVEEHKDYFYEYNKAPGAFETFGNMKKVASLLESYEDGEQGSEKKIQEQLYKDYGIDNLKNCSDFAKEYKEKLGLFGRKDSAIDQIIDETAGKGNKDSEKAICAEVNEYIDCLNEFSKIHKGHVNQGKDYKKDIGVYYHSDAHKNSISK